MKYKLLHQLEMNTTVLAVTLFQKNFRKQNIRPFVIGYHSLMVETDRSIRIHLSVAHRHFNLKTSLQPFQIKKKESLQPFQTAWRRRAVGATLPFRRDGWVSWTTHPSNSMQTTYRLLQPFKKKKVQTVEMFGVDDDHLALPLPLHSPSRRCRPSLWLRPPDNYPS